MAHKKMCRYCGKVLPFDAQNCEYCGKYLMKPQDNSGLVCAKCKASVNEDDNFCQKCGAIFNLDFYKNQEPEPLPHNVNGIPYNIGILLTSLAASIAISVFAGSGKEMGIGQYFLYFGIGFIASEVFLYIYFLPSILAFENNNPNAYFIYICNLLLGATVIGWFISLVFALQNKQKEE